MIDIPHPPRGLSCALRMAAALLAHGALRGLQYAANGVAGALDTLADEALFRISAISREAAERAKDATDRQINARGAGGVQ